MVRLLRKPKIEVTVNDSGFDNPNSGTIKKQREIWTASLVYPNPNGRLFEYFSSLDVIKIYLGLDELPDKPTFTGFVTSELGERTKQLALHGRLYSANKDSVIIDEYSNLDGLEVSQAIYSLIDNLDISFTTRFNGTNPSVFVPDDFRYGRGIIVYSAIKQLRDMAYDDSEFGKRPLYYFLYEEGDKLFFRKEPELVEANSWFTLTGGDNLIKGEPKAKTYGVINKQTVIGKDGVRATYTSAHRMAVDGTFAGNPIYDDSLLSAAECYEKARVEVEENKFKTINTEITALEMIDAVPGLTIVEIQNSKNIVSGLHRAQDIDIRFGKGFSISTRIEKDIPVFGTEVALLLPSSS